MISKGRPTRLVSADGRWCNYARPRGVLPSVGLVLQSASKSRLHELYRRGRYCAISHSTCQDSLQTALDAATSCGAPHRWENLWRKFRQPLESFELLRRAGAGNTIHFLSLRHPVGGTFQLSSSCSCFLDLPSHPSNLTTENNTLQRTTTCSLRIAQPFESFRSL